MAPPTTPVPVHATLPSRSALSTSFTAAWLADDPAALELLPRDWTDPRVRAAAVATASARRADPAVLAAIRTATPAQQANLDALTRGGAAAVVTGQQAGLFGGPLYTVYKAATAIVTATALARETGAAVVPVFWLQDEDHDFDEIASAAIPAPSGDVVVRVEGDPGPAERSVAFRRLGPSALDALDQTTSALAGLPHADEVVALLRACWRPDASPAAAVAAWIDALFAEHGLLVVDPAAVPAEAAAPVHRRAIDDSSAIAALLQERASALEAAGFAVQVHVREDSPLSFLHPDGQEGPRFRVEPASDALRLCGTDRTVSREALARGPWSTSALLRPVLQDHWLPTAAYVGGPGEIAYLAQLPPLYAHLGLPMPMILPRARFEVVDDGCRRLLEGLALSRSDLDLPRPRLLERIARPTGDRPDPDALLASLVDPIRDTLDRFSPHAEALDPGLAKAREKTERALIDGATRLVDRYRRSLAADDDTRLARLDRLLARLRPSGAPQERVHAWPWYGARYGVTGFVEAVLAAVRPYEGALLELDP